VALTAQNVSKSESSSLRKPEITAETDDDTSIRTPEPFLTVAFVILKYDKKICVGSRSRHVVLFVLTSRAGILKMSR
jgi:hypothetical protein